MVIFGITFFFFFFRGSYKQYDDNLSNNDPNLVFLFLFLFFKCVQFLKIPKFLICTYLCLFYLFILNISGVN